LGSQEEAGLPVPSARRQANYGEQRFRGVLADIDPEFLDEG